MTKELGSVRSNVDAIRSAETIIDLEGRTIRVLPMVMRQRIGVDRARNSSVTAPQVVRSPGSRSH